MSKDQAHYVVQDWKISNYAAFMQESDFRMDGSSYVNSKNTAQLRQHISCWPWRDIPDLLSNVTSWWLFPGIQTLRLQGFRLHRSRVAAATQN